MYRFIPPLIVLVPQDSNVALYAQVCRLCCALYMEGGTGGISGTVHENKKIANNGIMDIIYIRKSFCFPESQKHASKTLFNISVHSYPRKSV